MSLSKIGEFGLISMLRELCQSQSRDVLIGMGDDSAAISPFRGTTLITSDMLLEGVHFDLSFITFFQLGYKSLAVSLSDIFAMGGRPRYFLMNLGLPPGFDSRDIREIYRGIKEMARKAGVVVIGGDTCESRHGLVLSGTLIGDTDRAITRSGARPGDGIFVTGTLGDSAMGLVLLKELGRRIEIQSSRSRRRFRIRGIEFPAKDILPLLKKHLMPEPVPLKDLSGVTSMIDISDGLLIDLSHICDESKVGAIIYEDKIPLSLELIKAAETIGVDPLKLAMKGGEDYVLLFTAPPDIKTDAIMIGEVVKKGRFIVDNKGRRARFKAEGFEHFKEQRL